MQMRNHIAQDVVIVHLGSLERLLQYIAHMGQIVKISYAFCGAQFTGFDHMLSADEDAIPLDKLILCQKQAAKGQIGNRDPMRIF